MNIGGDCWGEGSSEIEVDVARVGRGLRGETIRQLFCWTAMLMLPSCPKAEWRWVISATPEYRVGGMIQDGRAFALCYARPDLIGIEVVPCDGRMMPQSSSWSVEWGLVGDV